MKKALLLSFIGSIPALISPLTSFAEVHLSVAYTIHESANNPAVVGGARSNFYFYDNAPPQANQAQILVRTEIEGLGVKALGNTSDLKKRSYLRVAGDKTSAVGAISLEHPIFGGKEIVLIFRSNKLGKESTDEVNLAMSRVDAFFDQIIKENTHGFDLAIRNRKDGGLDIETSVHSDSGSLSWVVDVLDGANRSTTPLTPEQLKAKAEAEEKRKMLPEEPEQTPPQKQSNGAGR